MAGIRTEPLGYALGAASVEAAFVVLALQRPAAALLVAAVLVVATLAFLRPGAMLLAAAAGVVLSADVLGLVTGYLSIVVAGFQIDVTDILLAVILLAAFARSAQPRPRLPYRSIVAMPAFGAWVVFATLGAYDLARGGYGTLSSVRIFGYCLVVPLIVRSTATSEELRWLGRAVVFGGAIASVAALAMLAMGRNSTPAGLSTGGVRGLSIGGSFLVAAALLYVLAGVAAGGRIDPWTVLLVLLLGGGVAASGARETWIGLLLAVALFAVGVPLGGTLRLALVFVLAGLVAAGAYAAVPHPPQMNERLASLEQRLLSVRSGTQDPSVTVRYEKWRIVWEQARAHPYLGTGFGYPATYTSNIGGNNFVRSYVDDPENTQLWLLARMGVAGFAAWVALNLAVLAQLLRTARARPGTPRVAALWGAGILGVVWAGMAFSPVSAFASTLLLYWFAVALAPVAGGIDR